MAGSAIGGEVALPRLDVVFGLAAGHDGMAKALYDARRETARAGREPSICGGGCRGSVGSTAARAPELCLLRRLLFCRGGDGADGFDLSGAGFACIFFR